MALEFVNSPSLHPPAGYTYAVIGTGSRIIHLAGQVSADQEGNLVGEADLAIQVEQCFVNLAEALAAAGASMDDLAKIGIYVVEYTEAFDDAIARGYRAAMERTGLGLPAAVLLGVQALAMPGALVEIDGVAIAN
ncbi:Rid family hydrolase [Nocardioides sp. CER19]|uniref:RidA family protein n=1 Tax=Nocardioides sp. CER19 TaxID=3038538 RepID=UPI002447E0E3|nr:Rid family hydrolase [Nocardioides sp. CER19]MDH2416158.1 Rid family hydrolase [Nocardioides sp. CER19]